GGGECQPGAAVGDHSQLALQQVVGGYGLVVDAACLSDFLDQLLDRRGVIHQITDPQNRPSLAWEGGEEHEQEQAPEGRSLESLPGASRGAKLSGRCEQTSHGWTSLDTWLTEPGGCRGVLMGPMKVTHNSATKIGAKISSKANRAYFSTSG